MTRQSSNTIKTYIPEVKHDKTTDRRCIHGHILNRPGSDHGPYLPNGMDHTMRAEDVRYPVHVEGHTTKTLYTFDIVDSDKHVIASSEYADVAHAIADSLNKRNTLVVNAQAYLDGLKEAARQRELTGGPLAATGPFFRPVGED